jgi:phosphatidate cytidylyltransferase
MNNFWQRTFTGAVYVAAVIFSALWGNWTWFIFLFAVNLFALHEFYKLMLPDKSWLEQYIGVIAGSVINVMFIFIIRGDLSVYWCYHLVPVFLVLFIIKLFENSGHEFETLAYQVFGLIYICLPLSVLAGFGYFNATVYSPYIALGFFILQWTSDTGAYLAGKSLGRHLLFERISPKKTIEGSIGGIILTIAMALLLSHFWDDLDRRDWVMTGIIISVFGTFGDLFESLMKRRIGIKDSGTILPGHGGVLDRFDSIFLSAPAVYFYLVFTG